MDDETRARWLKLRESHVTATDISAVVYDLRMRRMNLETACAKRASRKLLPKPFVGPWQRLRWGHLIETLAPAWYAELSEITRKERGSSCILMRPTPDLPIMGKLVHPNLGGFCSREMGEIRAGCTPDWVGIVTAPERAEEMILVEVKNVGPTQVRAWLHGPPWNVRAQLRWQLLVCGLRKGHVLAAVGGNPFRVWAEDLDQSEAADTVSINSLMAIGRAMMGAIGEQNAHFHHHA